MKKVVLIFCLIAGLAACKNEGDNSLVGKWREVKARAYYKSYSGAISNDTTYTGAAFDTTDYALFSANGTCLLSKHSAFYPTTANLIGDLVLFNDKENYNYGPIGFGPNYVLTPNTPPGGLPTTDTLSRSGSTILIHTVADTHANYVVTDAYYTR